MQSSWLLSCFCGPPIGLNGWAEEKSIAFPRLTLDGYAPFFGVMRNPGVWILHSILPGFCVSNHWDNSSATLKFWALDRIGRQTSNCLVLLRPRKFFDECWTKLGPEGLPDMTPRPDWSLEVQFSVCVRFYFWFNYVFCIFLWDDTNALIALWVFVRMLWPCFG